MNQDEGSARRLAEEAVVACPGSGAAKLAHALLEALAEKE